ncbi:hypothetical protein LTR08_008660 [Meristemomyces frigidus]|nr:hypothetical protein LTR08_008660 [Meristemomyces frigidus]
MPLLEANDITINYLLESPPEPSSSNNNELVVLINGLADDLGTWSYQIPALHAAGFTTLRYDNRGIGRSSKPPGPYSAEQMADDLQGLLLALATKGEVKRDEGFHLVGVSMGGMIAQAYALRYPNASLATSSSSASGQGLRLRMKSLSLCCTYAQPTAFCTRMFALWADMAAKMSVADVMRDVTLWAFTVPFFRTRTEELEEVEEAMRGLDMSLEAYLAQLHVIQKFDTTSALGGLKAEERVLGGLEGGEVMVLAGKTDLLIPVVLSRELAELCEGGRFVTVKGGHGCMWEFPEEFNKALVGFLRECGEKKA